MRYGTYRDRLDLTAMIIRDYSESGDYTGIANARNLVFDLIAW